MPLQQIKQNKRTFFLFAARSMQEKLPILAKEKRKDLQ
jgi:hypothetical protein